MIFSASTGEGGVSTTGGCVAVVVNVITAVIIRPATIVVMAAGIMIFVFMGEG